jgi:enterochelin esterase-like enzyme
VLYLFHGAGDWDVAWTDVDRANLILDNMIADGKAKPMIVVMPAIFQQAALASGAMAQSPGRGAAPFGGGGPVNAAASGQDDSFTRELLQDIMPFMQKRFRVKTGPDNTAIAGLSMGGAQSLRTGLAHLEAFHYVIGLSSAVGLGGGRGTAASSDPTAAYPALMADVPGANKKLKLFAMFCGAEDTLLSNNKTLASAFTAKGVNVKYIETAGAHWHIVWRRNLRDFAPLLF